MPSDRTKLWLLNMIVVLSGLFIGLPLVNFLFFLLAEAALIIMMVRYRYAFMVFPCFMALGLSIIVYGGMTAVVFAYLVLLPGLIMGYKARTFNTPNSIIAWGMAPYIVPVVLSIIFYSDIVAYSPALVAEFHSVLGETAAGMGIANAELQSILQSSKMLVEWVLRLTPGLIFTMFLGLVLFAYLAAMAANKYFGAVLPKILPLYFWKASEIWLIPLGVSMLFVLLGGGGGLRIIGENLLVFFVHFYAFLGICLVDFYFNRINIPVPVRMIIYLITMVVVFFAIPVLALLGVIDSRFDFRKIGFEAEN